jgi:hypothetical protein
MQNYQELTQYCLTTLNNCIEAIDQYVIPYFTDEPQFFEKSAKAIKKYIKQLDKVSDNSDKTVITSYMLYLIFRDAGYFQSYVSSYAFSQIPKSHSDFLRSITSTPWRASLATIIGNPEPDFLEMEDVLTGDKYLLFSPSIQNSKDIDNVRLCFNLIFFNGQCWQTYGSIGCFYAFSMDDIYFFARQLDPNVVDENDLLKLIHANSLPFFMLSFATNKSIRKHNTIEMVHCFATDIVKPVDLNILKQHFRIQYNKKVIQMFSIKWIRYPHSAYAYYDTKKCELVRLANTFEGFEAFTDELMDAGFYINPGFDECVSSVMFIWAQFIFDKNIQLGPDYKSLFSNMNLEDNYENSIPINIIFYELLEYHNAGESPDIKSIAMKYGQSEAWINELWGLIYYSESFKQEE